MSQAPHGGCRGGKEHPEVCQGLRKSHGLLLRSKWEEGRGRARRLLCNEAAEKGGRGWKVSPFLVIRDLDHLSRVLGEARRREGSREN